MKPLTQDFYLQGTKTVAKQLLGKILYCRSKSGELRSGKIVETEAYLGIKDPACHSFGNRRTSRTESMYLDGGHTYVYLIYGMYYCLNVVTRTAEHPEAVLIRAIEPISSSGEFKTNGPGKLCRYLEIDKSYDRLSLFKKTSNLWISDGEVVKPQLIKSVPRVGIDYAGEAIRWPLRFYVGDSRFVSR